MSQHTKRVVILFSLLVSISLLSLNSYGQGGSAEKTPPPSTKPTTRSSQPVKRGTTSSRGNRSTSTAKESDESSATLEETLKFIHEMIEANPSRLYPVVSFSQVTGCKVKMRTNFIGSPVGAADSKYAIETFSLADISPKSIEVDEGKVAAYPSPFGEIHFNTTLGEKNIQIESNISTQEGERDLSFLSSNIDGSRKESGGMFVSDKETATRIANALRHAIMLYGGKSDPF